MDFKLSEEQFKKFKEWSSKNSEAYTGAIGGRYTFLFTVTSIGEFVTVEDLVTKEKLDLTESDLL